MNKSQHFRTQLRILASMYLGYGAMMVSRQMVTILSPALLADETLSLTKTNIGDFAAYGTLGALAGKLIWGPVTDKIGGRKTFLIGITLTAFLVAAFGFSPNVLAFSIFSFLLYCTKSSGWPGLTKLVGNWYHPKKYGRVWGILSTSSRASVVLGTLFFGWLLSYTSWRNVAFAATAVGLLIFFVCYFFLDDKPENEDFIEKDGQGALEENKEHLEESKKALENLKNHPLKNTNLVQGLFAFAKSMRVWLVVIMMMLLTCLMAFLDFLGVYLMEVYNLTPSQASMASSVFPLGSLAGLLGAVAFYDKFSKKGLRRVLTITLGVASVCILMLQYLPELGVDSGMKFNIALVSIFIFGASISPAYYIPMSIFSIEFGGPHSATLVCLLDAFGFAASASFGFIGGRLADSSGGWGSFMNMIVFVVVLATLSVWGFLHAEYKADHPGKL